MCGGVVLPYPTDVPWSMQTRYISVVPSSDPTATHPIVWRRFLADIVSDLVSWDILVRTVTNYGNDLSGRILPHACIDD